MKKFIIALFSIAAAASASVAMAADVGVSVRIGDPNFYGQIDIGNYPQPTLIYSQPQIIAAPVGAYVPPPLYLRVPPGHYRNWRRFCGRYDACGRPVYFVQDNWYQNVYVPRYREHDHSYEGRRDEWHGDRHEGWRDGRHDDRRDDRHDDRRHDDRREGDRR